MAQSPGDVDRLVLGLLCRAALASEGREVSVDTFRQYADVSGVSPVQIRDSLVHLHDSGYVDVSWSSNGSDPISMRLSLASFSRCVQANVEDLAGTIEAVRREVRGGGSQDTLIAEAVSQPRWLVDHVLELLERDGLVRLRKLWGKWLVSPTPRLRGQVQQ